MNNRILIVAPHPDDETLGCGGALLKYKNNNDKIYWMIVTNIHSRNGWTESMVKKRQQEIDTVANSYGFEKTYKLDYPSIMLDTIPYREIIEKMNEVLEQVQPTIIFIPYCSDVHSDHRVTFNAVYSCTKNFRKPYIEKIYMYETLSETEFAPALQATSFIPNVYIDVTDYFEKKIEIMKLYDTEIMAEPWPRSISSIRALGRYRGSRIAVQYAEAFMLLFEKQ